jgi:hypothetical protein
MMRGVSLLLASLAVLLWLGGCRIRTEKGNNGEEKSVQIDTPFGGVHVNTDQTTASDLGLPTYPGATVVRDDQNHESADVHMGFGEWQLRVRAVSYESNDGQDKVTAFYKKALGRYGDVLTCHGNAPVGTPAATSEGLDCSDTGKNSHININGKGNGIDFSGDLQLKAGSKRHQHIVGFEEPHQGKTRFALVAIDLPAGVEPSGGKSD